jgi:inner membrane protein
MLLAHLPAGFLLTQALIHDRVVHGATAYWRYLLLGLLASVLPDLDLFYYYLVDQQQHLHHSYWTHLPIYWYSLYLLCLLLVMMVGQRSWLLICHIIFLNVLLHCVLDSVNGGIRWLSPWDMTYFRLFSVPKRTPLWYGNFIWHWTFLFEISIIVSAVWFGAKLHGRRVLTWCKQ